jgi:hypothetical protein
MSSAANVLGVTHCALKLEASWPAQSGLRCVKSTSLPKPKSTHKLSLDLPQCKEKHPPTLAFNNIYLTST